MLTVYFFTDFLTLEIVFPQLGTALELDLKQSNCNRSLPSYLQNGKHQFARTYTEIWEQSAKVFEHYWQFPNYIGSIDRKHTTIKGPNETGSNHFYYLNEFSIVLMAIVGPDYRFICVDIGAYGKNNDGGIFDSSNRDQKFEEGLMNIPKDKPLPGQNVSCSHVLIGDEAFALKPNLMRPFPQGSILVRKITTLDCVRQEEL